MACPFFLRSFSFLPGNEENISNLSSRLTVWEEALPKDGGAQSQKKRESEREKHAPILFNTLFFRELLLIWIQFLTGEDCCWYDGWIRGNEIHAASIKIVWVGLGEGKWNKGFGLWFFLEVWLFLSLSLESGGVGVIYEHLKVRTKSGTVIMPWVWLWTFLTWGLIRRMCLSIRH